MFDLLAVSLDVSFECVGSYEMVCLIECKQLRKKHLDLKFLTGGPWTPNGSVERVLGVCEDHNSKVFNLFFRYVKNQELKPSGSLVFLNIINKEQLLLII